MQYPSQPCIPYDRLLYHDGYFPTRTRCTRRRSCRHPFPLRMLHPAPYHRTPGLALWTEPYILCTLNAILEPAKCFHYHTQCHVPQPPSVNALLAFSFCASAYSLSICHLPPINIIPTRMCALGPKPSSLYDMFPLSQIPPRQIAPRAGASQNLFNVCCSSAYVKNRECILA